MSTKKLGRPRKFEEHHVLEAVVQVFWEKGFEGASMSDFTAMTGLNKPSLYAAFGDKNALYLRALTHYAETKGSAGMRAFLAADTIGQAVEAFLQQALILQTSGCATAKGCLLGNCAVASVGSVPESAELLRKIDDQTVSALTARFETAIQIGELAEGFPSAQRARLLADLLSAQASAARLGSSYEALSEAIGWKCALVLSDSGKTVL